MKIIALMENTCETGKFAAEHGLSIYVECKNQKILVDTGASDLTWDNAAELGVDVKDIDLLVLSHGHYDHSGGIMTFAKQNDKAAIYMQSTAPLEYYAADPEGAEYIGIDKKIADLENCIMLNNEVHNINENVTVFGNVTGRRCWPQSNKRILKKIGDALVQDDFEHEQYVVIEEDGKSVLVSGCAHNGVLNILDKYREIFNSDPDLVISGFHMMKKSEYTKEEIDTIVETAEELNKKKTVFYTGHCTGIPAFEIMKKIMGDKLKYIHSGDQVLI